ncbi:MAG TPA: hypothetical protein ENK95_01920 [Campylobacterales bacterium]|nr:hypothetical protein [Campylobacterales bacterium]
MKQKSILTLLLLTIPLTTSFALVDIEKEMYEPAAEIEMLDEAMNKGIQEQHERNLRKPMLIEENHSFYTDEPLAFVLKGNQYILEKKISDVNNTTVKASIKDRKVTVTETKKIEEVFIEDSVTLGSEVTKKQYFESTSTETLDIPLEADEKSFQTHYEKGVLSISLKKR